MGKLCLDDETFAIKDKETFAIKDKETPIHINIWNSNVTPIVPAVSASPNVVPNAEVEDARSVVQDIVDELIIAIENVNIEFAEDLPAAGEMSLYWWRVKKWARLLATNAK